MWDRITPPKIVPSALVSLGSRSTLIAGTRSGMAPQLIRSAESAEGTERTSGLRTWHFAFCTRFELRTPDQRRTPDSAVQTQRRVFCRARVFFVYSDFP